MPDPPLRAILDTNVIASAALKPESVPAAVVSGAMTGFFTVCVSDPILKEYRDVLTRGKFRFPPELVVRFLDDLEGASWKVTPREAL